MGRRGDSAPPLSDVLGRLGAADRPPPVRPVVSVVALSLRASGGRRQPRAAAGLRLTPHKVTERIRRDTPAGGPERDMVVGGKVADASFGEVRNTSTRLLPGERPR